MEDGAKATDKETTLQFRAGNTPHPMAVPESAIQPPNQKSASTPGAVPTDKWQHRHDIP